MSDSSQGPKRGPFQPNSRNSMNHLQEEMAEAAGTAARNAADSVAQAVGAITVAFGLKVARPVAEMAEDLGITIGDALSALARERDDIDDLEIISVDFPQDSDK